MHHGKSSKPAETCFAAACTSSYLAKKRLHFSVLYGMQRLNILVVGLTGLMHACRVNSAKRLRHLFEQIDTDHDGKFDASDFRFFLHKSSMRLEKMTQVSRNSVL